MTESDPATVLVVDDEAEVADSYAAQLADVYDVRTAYSGSGALEEMAKGVDVVLLDRRMPDISGDEVLERIREEFPEIRVAMVTAVDPDFDIIDMPLDDYVVKPVSRDGLLGTIERLLACAEYEAELQEFYSLTVKSISLKRSKTSVELAESEEFAGLEDRREELEERLAELEGEFEDHEFLTVMQGLEGRYGTVSDH